MSQHAQQHHLAVDAQTLREALEAHQRYLAGRSGGRRLNLTRASLRGADLRGAHAVRARFLEAEMDGARIASCDLTGAELEV